MTFSAYVVDDEPRARENLLSALSGHSDWRVLREFSSGKHLMEHLAAERPDVIFLDIQMPGDNGLELARRMQCLKDPPLVVFVTAFSDYAVTAFELYALDYLLKPFDDARVDMCIAKLERVLGNQSAFSASLDAQSAWARNKPIEKIVIRSSSSLRVIPIEQVMWVAANGNYVDIHHCEGKHLLRGSLKSIFETLPKPEFIQVHRGYAVRTSLIRELKTQDEEKFTITLADGVSLPVGKTFRAELVDAMMSV